MCAEFINRIFTWIESNKAMKQRPLPCFPSNSHWTSHFYTVEETQDLFPMRLKTTFTWQLVDRKSLLGHQFALAYASPSCLYFTATHPSPSLTERKKTTSPPFYFHTATASLTSHTIIILPIPPHHKSDHILLALFPRGPSISARLGRAGVPLTTTLHWLLLKQNLPRSHLLDVHQHDTDRDRQCARVRGFRWLHLSMECSN